MPIRLQRSSSSSSLKLWEKRTRSSGSRTSTSSLLPPSKIIGRTPPTITATATKSHPLRPPLINNGSCSASQPIKADTNTNSNSNTKSNTKTMGGNNVYVESTESLIDHGYNLSDDGPPGFTIKSSKRRSLSFSRRGSRQFEYQYHEDGHSSSIQNPKNEGIEAMLSPTIRSIHIPLPFQETKERPPSQPQPHQRRQRWSCFAPRQIDFPVPPVLTAVSSSEDCRQTPGYDDHNNGQQCHPQQQQQQQQQQQHDQQQQQTENWDYAFDADVWNASHEYDDHDFNNKNEVSLVDTTFMSNSSASSTSSPHPDPIVAPNVTVADGHNNTNNDGANNDDGIRTTKKKCPKWKKRLFSWGKGRHKLKRSNSLESLRNSTNSGGASPSRKVLPNLTDWPAAAGNNGKHHYDDGGGADPSPDNIAWEPPVVDGDQVECEYRGNISVQDWFTAQDAGGGNDLERSSSFELVGLSTDSQRDANKTNLHDNNAASMGEEEESLVDADDPPEGIDTNNGVMELGRYAREMQSKPSATPSPKGKPKKLRSSLLCALPSLAKKRSKDDDDFVKEQFPDPIDEILGYESDSNSYLAVSYSEECAQLVMQQSEDVQDAPQVNDGYHQNSLPENEQQVSSPEISGYMGDDSGTVRTDAEGLHFLAEHSIHTSRSQSSSKLGASFGHPAAQLRDDFVSQLSGKRQLSHPPTVTSTTEEEEDDASDKIFKAITQGLTISDTPGRFSSSRARPSRIQGSPLDTAIKVKQPIEWQLTRSFDREIVGGITYHHYKATTPPPPPPPLPQEPITTAKIAQPVDDSSIHTPPPIKTMRSNLLNKKISEGPEAWLLQRRDDPPPPDPASDPSQEDEAEAQVQASEMYRYYCPSDTPTSSSYHASLSNTSARYRAALSNTATKYRPACAPPKLPACAISKSSDPEISWDTSTVGTFDSQNASTLSYSELIYPQGRQSTTMLAATAADIWDVYRPVRQLAKEVGDNLCENVYPRHGQPSTVPFDEMDKKDSHRRPWTKVRDSGKANYYERGLRDNDRNYNDHPPRDRHRNRQFSHDEASYFSKPDPPSEATSQTDFRRQLV